MTPKRSRQKPFRWPNLPFIAIVLCVALSACIASRVYTRGNLPDPERLSELVPGETTRDDILDSLGSPSSVNTFGNETWYYISEKVEVVAFLSPKVLERKILIVEFNLKSQMTQVVTLGLEAGRELIHAERITPTFGQELTVLDQIIGNFNRFKTGKQRKGQ